MEQAKKQDSRNSTRGNTSHHKEDLIKTHKRAKIKKFLPDPRMAEVKLLLTHPRKSVQNITVENYAVESKVRYWKGMGYDVTICN